MSYQVGFCFWLLTFEQEIAEQINKKFDIIPLLTTVAQTAVKEKVIRVIIATFRVCHRLCHPYDRVLGSIECIPITVFSEPGCEGPVTESAIHASCPTLAFRKELGYAKMV